MVHLKLLVLICLLFSVQAAKFLLIPGPGVSHCLETMAIGKDLLGRGHHVTLFAHFIEPKACVNRWKFDSSKFKMVSPKVDSDVADTFNRQFSEAQKALRGANNFLWFIITKLKPNIEILCRSSMSDQRLMQELEKDNYDLALVEGLPYTSCLFAVAVHLGIQYASIASFVDLQDTGIPLQSNTFPHIFLEYTNEMSYKERFLNTLVFFLNPVFRYFMIPNLDLSEYSDNSKGVDIGSLIKDSVLFLENSDYIIDYPKAVFPNFVQVGGLTCTPADPLPSDLQKYIQESKEGVILVTFGSVLKNIPDTVTEKIVKTLQRFKERIILKHDKEQMIGNIKSVKWVPQNDVLGHPKVKLFISHCGKNGLWEGIYHGVPIICTPFGTDAITNGMKVKKYEVGSSINIFDASSDELYETITSVLNDKGIKKNMAKMSALLRDRTETPSQRAASALEHVVKYGGEHMRPAEPGFLSNIYADVWITIFLIVIILCKLFIILCHKCRHKPKTD